jgi:hypothetical protein
MKPGQVKDLVKGDDKLLEKLIKKRKHLLDKIARDVDNFIRVMGWQDAPPAKRQKLFKVPIAGSTPADIAKKASKMFDDEARDADDDDDDEDEDEEMGDEVPSAKPTKSTVSSLTGLSDIANLDIGEGRKGLNMKTLEEALNEIEVAGGGLFVYRNAKGAIKTRGLTAKSVKGMAKSKDKVVDIFGFNYYWLNQDGIWILWDTEEYEQHLDKGGEEAELWEYGKKKKGKKAYLEDEEEEEEEEEDDEEEGGEAEMETNAEGYVLGPK